ASRFMDAVTGGQSRDAARDRGARMRYCLTFRALLDRAAMQVGFDLKPCAAAEAGAIDLQILHDPLHVVTGLGERNLFNPVDRVDLGIARIAVAIDPLLHAAAAGI